jgi:hypothetical protein
MGMIYVYCMLSLILIIISFRTFIARSVGRLADWQLAFWHWTGFIMHDYGLQVLRSQTEFKSITLHK